MERAPTSECVHAEVDRTSCDSDRVNHDAFGDGKHHFLGAACFGNWPRGPNAFARASACSFAVCPGGGLVGVRLDWPPSLPLPPQPPLNTSIPESTPSAIRTRSGAGSWRSRISFFLNGAKLSKPTRLRSKYRGGEIVQPPAIRANLCLALSTLILGRSLGGLPLPGRCEVMTDAKNTREAICLSDRRSHIQHGLGGPVISRKSANPPSRHRISTYTTQARAGRSIFALTLAARPHRFIESRSLQKYSRYHARTFLPNASVAGSTSTPIELIVMY